jgi:hypothetical protein
MGRGAVCRNFGGFFPFMRSRLTKDDERSMIADEAKSVSAYLDGLQSRLQDLGEQ